MLKFAIIGPLTENTKDLLEAIEKAGHQGTVIRLADVVFEMRGNSFLAEYGKQDVFDFDLVIFRGYNEHIYEAQLLAQMLVEKGKIIIEQTLAGSYVRGKMMQSKRLSQHNIRQPKTFQASNPDGWKRILEKKEFPIIAKPVFGRKGRGVQKIDDIKEAEAFFQINTSDYLAQQYFPILKDFRVLVIGGEVIGGFQRFINEGEYKSNIRGTRAEKIQVSEEMKEIAISSTVAMGYEIAGVDLFEYENQIYVIEVNVSPQWEKFKFVTGINPADKIIEYAIRKNNKK
jgi:RimK family alpha-L-glutamate ligase